MQFGACAAAIVCAGVAVIGAARLEQRSSPEPAVAQGTRLQDCQSCHGAIADTYRTTAHARTSSARIDAVLGPTPAEVGTSVPTTRFRVERRGNDVHQTAVWMADDRVMTRSERIDVVVGSGRRGQSYLYWKDGRLYQLPLSYLVPAGRWTNSPGYIDGQVHFDRLIPPRCLECHATSWPSRPGADANDRGRDEAFGLACEVCHRPGESSNRSPTGGDHPALRVVNPAGLTRQQQIDLCGLCHSGADRPLRRPAFTFAAGDRLTDHLGPSERPDDLEPDAHGNQVALLASSRCFQMSPAMTCSTCHDVHETARDAARLSEKCAECHASMTGGHPETSVQPSVQSQKVRNGTCVDCHMPRRPSRLIRIAQDGRVLAPLYRTHRIAVYPEEAARIEKDNRGAAR